MDYNEAHGITPQSVRRGLQQSLHSQEHLQADEINRSIVAEDEAQYDTREVIAELEEQMRIAASRLEFERAAHLRDQITTLKQRLAADDR